MSNTSSLFAAEGMDERSLEFLSTAIEQSNLPGFDYFEFKKATKALLQLNSDEAAAFKNAFTTAAVMGLTKEKLLETAAYYRNLLEKEKEKFNAALANQTAAKVTAKEEEIKRLLDQIERHKAEIVRLQEEMAAYRTQIEASETAVKTESEKISKASDGFARTHTAMLLQMDKDIENIHKYL